MSATYDNVIVFGPTGDVGGHVAREANKRGAKVWLAMRDPAKRIDGISEQEEQQGSYNRLQADLSDAASVEEAIRKSGAKAAFLYLAHTREGPKDAIAALKKSGVEYVVFLSSFSLEPYDDIRKIPQSEIIPFAHAQAEVAFEDVGLAFTALRPGYFASNPYKMNLDRSKAPHIASLSPEANEWDYITPTDIGRVGGAVLVNRPSTSIKEVIYLFGPRLVSQTEAWNVISNASSQEIKVEYLSSEDYLQSFIAKHIPPPIAKYLVESFDKTSTQDQYPEPLFSKSVANVKKYSGYEPISFEEYAKSQGL